MKMSSNNESNENMKRQRTVHKKTFLNYVGAVAKWLGNFCVSIGEYVISHVPQTVTVLSIIALILVNNAIISSNSDNWQKNEPTHGEINFAETHPNSIYYITQTVTKDVLFNYTPNPLVTIQQMFYVSNYTPNPDTQHPIHKKFESEFCSASDLLTQFPDAWYTNPIYLTSAQRQVVYNIVCGEAGNEPYLGKIAVAICIANAMVKEDMTPSQIKSYYQYSGWYNINAYNDSVAVAEIKDAVEQVFDNGLRLTNYYTLWFYAPKYAVGKFHNTQHFDFELGGHRFFSPIGGYGYHYEDD